MRRKCLRLLTKLDKLLCKFFGLKPQKSMRPDSVKICQRTIRIESSESSESCQRMRHVLNWEQYRQQELQHLSLEDKAKLGVALGKAIATDFVVTFDEPVIIEKKQKP